MGINNKLDLNLVRVFLAVYDTGSINGAARQLHLTQPAVSNAVRRLNERMGRQLFFRAGRGIRPSEEATHLYHVINKPYELLTDAFSNYSTFDPASSNRKFSLALSHYCDALMPGIAKAIEAAGPGVVLERVSHQPESYLRDLRAGSLDMVLTTKELRESGLSICNLYSDSVVLVARPEHPSLKSLSRLTLSLMRKLRFVSVVVEGARPTPVMITLQEKGCTIYMHTTSLTNLLEIVMCTNHVALIPRFALASWQNQSPRQYQVPFEAPEVPLKLVWCKRNDHEGGNVWLRSLLQTVVDEVVKERKLSSQKLTGECVV